MFDPKAPLVGSDCLQYANVAARLKGEPLDNPRNRAITGHFRQRGRTEREIDIFAQAFDAEALRQGYKGLAARTYTFADAVSAALDAGYCAVSAHTAKAAKTDRR